MKKKILISAILCIVMALSGVFVACGGGNVATTGVSLNKTSISMSVGESETLIATVTPSDATDKTVIWTSSNPSVASVGLTGKVTAVGQGSATITATTVNGNHKATCDVTVGTVAVTGITLNETELTMMVDSDFTLVANITPANATNKQVVWTSSMGVVASVYNGFVTAHHAGNVTITARTVDGGFVATCTINITPRPTPPAPTVNVTGVTLTPETLTLCVGDTATLSAAIEPANATNQTLIWESEDQDVVEVANGTITAVGVGSTTVYVTTQDGDFTDSCVITVNEAIPEEPAPVSGVTLDRTSAILFVNGTTTLNANVLPSNAENKNVVWNSNNLSVATVVDGVVTAVGLGTATITVTTEEGGYIATCNVTVTAAQLNVTSCELSVGSGGVGVQQLTVLLNGEETADVTWSSMNNSVATVSATGLVTAVGSGNTTIKAVISIGGQEVTLTCNVKVVSSDIQLPEI